MIESFELKAISKDAVGRAIEKAGHYRDLNDPGPAESICRDILAVDPDNHQARVILLLSLTDQFMSSGHSLVSEARACLEGLKDEYERAYYGGLIYEREGRAALTRQLASQFAWGDLRHAMHLYEQAEKLRPPGNDDAILRWNSCVRVIERENLQPPDDSPQELPLE